MKLRIVSTSLDVNNKFIEYLIKQIKQHILDNLDVKKAAALDSYLIRALNLSTSASKIILQAANNLKYTKIGIIYIIEIDNNIVLENTDAKLYDVCKLINYGNLSMKGYPIFTDTFNYFKQNLDTYKDLYRTTE